ncbi:hypothetical protein [Actinopolymorpha pittospori]
MWPNLVFYFLGHPGVPVMHDFGFARAPEAPQVTLEHAEDLRPLDAPREAPSHGSRLKGTTPPQTKAYRPPKPAHAHGDTEVSALECDGVTPAAAPKDDLAELPAARPTTPASNSLAVVLANLLALCVRGRRAERSERGR